MINAAHRRGRRLAEALPPPDFATDYGIGFDAGLLKIDPPAAPSREFSRGWNDGRVVFKRSIRPTGETR